MQQGQLVRSIGHELGGGESDSFGGNWGDLRHFSTVDDVEHLPINDQLLPDVPSENHAFIVLGYALTESGEVQHPLAGRLSVALQAAKKHENSKFILSGGFAKNGMTEADVMALRLMSDGVDSSSLIKEDQSRDTVENVLNTLAIIESEDICSATLITSATHMRRALALFMEADAKGRVSSHIAHSDWSNGERGFLPDERRLVIHDLQRIVTLQRRATCRIFGGVALKAV